MKEQDLRAVKRTKKPKLLKVRRRTRLRWALEYKNWTLVDWKRVIWSDGTKINRLNSNGIKYAWPKDPKIYPAEVDQEALKFGGYSAMIWGYTYWLDDGGMTRVEEKINLEQLIGILSTCLVLIIEVANKLFSIGRNSVIFRQDNGPKHTSRAAKDWIDSTGMNKIY